MHRVNGVDKNRVWGALLLVFLTFPLSAQQDVKLEQAEELFRHGQTYHWLGRAKHSNAEDFLTAQRYAGEAIELLEGLSGTEADKLRIRATYQLQDLANRYENNFDNIVNELPLFPLITRNQTTYEYVDDPPVTAVNRALEAGISALPPARPDLQYYTIIVSTPEEKALEDELRFSLGSDPRFFPRPDEDILQILTLEEFALLYDRDTAPTALSRLSKGWDKKYLMYVEIVENDLVDDVYYYGVFLRLFDAEQGGFVQSLYADGLTEDRRTLPTTLLLLFLFLVAVALAIPWAMHLLLAFQPRRERGTVAGHAGISAALIGLATAAVIVFAFSALAPEPATLMVMWSSRIWFYALTFLLVAFPVLLAYLAGSRIPGIKERLANANTLGALIGGSILGSGMLICAAYVGRYGVSAGIVPILLLTATSIFAGGAGGVASFRFFSHGKRLEMVPGIANIGAAVFVMGGLIAADYTQIYISAAVAAAVYVSMIGYYKLLTAMQRKQKVIDSADDEENAISLERLMALTNEPKVFIDPSETGSFISSQVKLYRDFYEAHHSAASGSKSPFFVYHIRGKAGTGKTRTASELSDKLISSYKEHYGYRGKVLFGDCDEMNSDGSGVPFEPFAQAFHKLLGAGRFEPPSKRAAKIANGLKSAGLETALGAAGLGALGSLMGLEHDEDESAAASSSLSEMAYTLSRALIELSKQDQALVILILDDMHFIDALSEELFEKLVHNLSVSRDTERIVLILTENPDNTPISTPADEKRWLKLLQEHSEHQSLTIQTIEGSQLSNPERFDDLLIDALWFNQDAAYQLMRSIEQYKPDSMQGILQTVAQMIKLDGLLIDERMNRINIRQGFNFELLPPPTSLQELVMAKLGTISEQQRNIVECAAFVGYEFNAEILADVLGIDRLVLLHELRELEQKGILHDEVNQDDVYAFNSGALAAAIRHQTNIGNVESATEVPQVVREYHHRVALSLMKQMKRFEETIHTIGINNLIALARRSYAAGDRMIADAFNFNLHAAERTAKLGRYTEALTFASQAVECARKLRSLQWSEGTLKMKALMVEMGTIQLRPETEIVPIIEDALEHSTHLKTEEARVLWKGRMLCRWADYMMSTKQGSFSEAAGPLTVQLEALLNREELPQILTIKMSLSLSRIASRIDSSCDHLGVLESLHKELNTLKGSTEEKEAEADVLRLESEILEDWGVETYQCGEYQESIANSQRAIDVKQNPSVNDIEGIAKMQYYMARSYLQLKQKEQSVSLLETAHTSAEKVGALEHKIAAALLLGELLSDSREERGIELFLEVLQDAHLVKDRLAELKALNGLLKIASSQSNTEMAREWEREIRSFLTSPDPKLPKILYDELESYAKAFSIYRK